MDVRSLEEWILEESLGKKRIGKLNMQRQKQKSWRYDKNTQEIYECENISFCLFSNGGETEKIINGRRKSKKLQKIKTAVVS